MVLYSFPWVTKKGAEIESLSTVLHTCLPEQISLTFPKIPEIQTSMMLVALYQEPLILDHVISRNKPCTKNLSSNATSPEEHW